MMATLMSIQENNDPLHLMDEKEPCLDSIWATDHDNCTISPSLLPDDDDIPQIIIHSGVFRADLGTLGWFALMALVIIGYYYVRRQRLALTSDTDHNGYKVVNMRLVENNRSQSNIDSSTGIEEAFDGCFSIADGLEGLSGHETSL